MPLTACRIFDSEFLRGFALVPLAEHVSHERRQLFGRLKMSGLARGDMLDPADEATLCHVGGRTELDDESPPPPGIVIRA